MRFRRHAQLISLLLSFSPALAGNYPTLSSYCFNQQTNSQLNCATPYASQSYGNAQSCTSQCQSQQNCQVAVYQVQGGMCRLYQQAPVTLNRGKRYASSGCGYRGPQVAPASGTNYYQWSGKCQRNQRPNTQPPYTLPPQTFPPQTPPRPLPTVFPPPNTAQTTIRLRPTTTTEPITDPPLPAEVTCPPGEIPRFLKIENYELVDFNDVTFVAFDQNECLQACAINRSPSGVVTPCLSFEFSASSRTCTLSVDAASPRGSGLLAPSDGMNYFEKTCLPGNLAEECSPVFDQLPQTVLVGHAQGVTTEATYTSCIRTCLDSERVVNFNCRSGQYYYDVDSFNCVLNTESKETQPDLITRVENELVNYFDFKCPEPQGRSSLGDPLPGDLKGRSLLNLLDPEWSQWSTCNNLKNRSYRFRNCKTVSPITCEKQGRFC